MQALNRVCCSELASFVSAQDRMPFVGPKKGALLQRLVRDRAPRLAVEVGTLCGYSALLIAKAMAPEARLVTLESDWKWALVAKRFVWQATQGDKLKPVRCCLVKRLTAVSGMFACVQFHLQDVGDMQHQGVCIIMSIRSICGDCLCSPTSASPV